MRNVAVRIAAVGWTVTAIAAMATGCGSASKVGPSASKRAHDGPLVYEISTNPQRPDTATQLAERLPNGTTRRLPPVPGGARQPNWSPDRTRIAFVRGLPNAAYEINRVLFGRRLPRARTEIDTADAAGRDVRRLVGDCPATRGCLFDAFPAWAPDRRISFLRFYGPARTHRELHFNPELASRIELLTVPADGGRPVTVRRWDSDLQPWDAAPRWSPDGRHIAVALGSFAHPSKHTSLGTALFVLDASGGAARRITPWELGAAYPDWSPDGAQIAFASAGGHSASLYVVRADGTGLRKLVQGDTRSSVGALQQPAWSPDGRRIAFAAQPRPTSSYHISQLDLFTVNSDGSQLRRMTTTDAYESAPAWGPS
jgi:dipeptidyl aminopeptidase/acylaminoacyl peptidase